MALLTDDDHISMQDMQALDPEIFDVSAAEGIAKEGDNSITRHAWDECASFLLQRMESFGGTVTPVAGGSLGLLQPRVTLRQIVVTDEYANRLSPVRRWMLYYALELFYRAAANRTLEDRYVRKAEWFEEAMKRHWKALWTRGLPIVLQPIPRPGALHERNSGRWGDAGTDFYSVAGGFEPAATWWGAVTWSGPAASRGGGESAPSDMAMLAVAPEQRLAASIARLNPPAGATGWNLYAGAERDLLYRQNAEPIPVETKQYPLTAAPATSGTLLGTGQAPDAWFAFQNLLQRA